MIKTKNTNNSYNKTETGDRRPGIRNLELGISYPTTVFKFKLLISTFCLQSAVSIILSHRFVPPEIFIFKLNVLKGITKDTKLRMF